MHFQSSSICSQHIIEPEILSALYVIQLLMEVSSMNLVKHLLAVFVFWAQTVSDSSTQKKKKKAQKKRIDFVSHLPPTSKLLRCVLHSSVFVDGRKKRERGEVRGSPMNNHSLITNSTSLFFQTSNTWLISFPSERIIVYLISPSREVTTYLRLSLSCFCIIFVGLQYFKIRATKAGLVTIQNMTNYGFRE